jgi:hypothetical protein
MASRGRKPYVKPQVRQVSLRPEEAVLGACKTTGVSGPAQSRCSIPVQCYTSGS